MPVANFNPHDSDEFGSFDMYRRNHVTESSPVHYAPTTVQYMLTIGGLLLAVIILTAVRLTVIHLFWR